MASIQNKALRPKHNVSSDAGYNVKDMPTKEDGRKLSEWLRKKGGQKLTAKQTMRRLFNR